MALEPRAALPCLGILGESSVHPVHLNDDPIAVAARIVLVALFDQFVVAPWFRVNFMSGVFE
ncbi:MAG TPA: hypothetical protein VD761_11430 [Solirubrobacterales bacterium]|nr:hypothetical protein [Solirubrobacterales bacterium]